MSYTIKRGRKGAGPRVFIYYLVTISFISLTLIAFFYFSFRKKVLNLELTSSNKMLRAILETSFKKETPQDAARAIIDILMKTYVMDYCTIYIYDLNRKYLNTLYSTGESEYIPEMEKYANKCFMDLKERGKSAAAVYDSTGLEYPSAKKRKIVYSCLIPLEMDKTTVGAILIEKKNYQHVEGYAAEIFKMCLENISISLDRLIYVQKIRESANIDGLTRSYNKSYMFQFLQKQIDGYRNTGHTFSLVIFDIDHFKKFNDTYGHLCGDKVLQELSAFIQENIRKETDFLFRYGGEEFVIYLNSCSSQDAYSKIESLRRLIEELTIKGDEGQDLKVTCSFGISQFPETTGALQELIKKADEALYISKTNGRNKVTLCSGL